MTDNNNKEDKIHYTLDAYLARKIFLNGNDNVKNMNDIDSCIIKCKQNIISQTPQLSGFDIDIISGDYLIVNLFKTVITEEISKDDFYDYSVAINGRLFKVFRDYDSAVTYIYHNLVDAELAEENKFDETNYETIDTIKKLIKVMKPKVMRALDD